jgi:hypothetical protein
MFIAQVSEPNELALVEMHLLRLDIRYREIRPIEARIPDSLVEGYIPKASRFGRALDIELAAEETIDLDATLPVS